MHPILFEHWGITLRWYGLFAAIGFFAAYFLFRTRANRIPLNENQTSNLMLLLFFSGILGARVFYVVWHWNDQGYGSHPIEILMIQKGGLVFFGGFFLACVALYFWCNYRQLSFGKVTDTLAPALALGHAFGRLGCFMNGCCYGLKCRYFWGVYLNLPAQGVNGPLHPTQIYEFTGLLCLALILIIIERRAYYPGQVALAYCLIYSMLRFFVEFFRGDVPHSYFVKLTLAQVVSLSVFFVAWVIYSKIASRSVMSISTSR
jgi:phosphatidylglycerol---prolipoprotein diacylglyceryl transferase